MIVNAAYMYMRKAVSKVIHLFSNGKANYDFAKLSGTATIDASGLLMNAYSKCRFSGLPLQDKTKLVINLTNRNYPQSYTGYVYIKTSGLVQKFGKGITTSERSAIFEIDIPTDAQIENAVFEIEPIAPCIFTDIAFE